MTANITRNIEEIKKGARSEERLVAKIELARELLDILDDKTIAIKTKLLWKRDL